MYKLVLIRHGESQWNKENRFTGWVDVDLSEKGIEEAKKAGQTLQKEGFVFDVAYTSVLKRAIHTLWNILDVMDLTWIPVYRSWRLNERHYGALAGLDKSETAAKHGEDQVKIWRRSFDIPPPPLDPTDPRFPTNDPRYADLDPRVLPATESLKTTSTGCCPTGTTSSCRPSAPASGWRSPRTATACGRWSSISTTFPITRSSA